MNSITIYHNPRCSKSRQTLQLLEEKGYQPVIVEYLKNPPDRDTIKHIAGLLGGDLRSMIRDHEEPWKTLNLGRDDITEDELITAMIENPILIQRPIVVVDNQSAIIGRPPENINKIL